MQFVAADDGQAKRAQITSAKRTLTDAVADYVKAPSLERANLNETVKQVAVYADWDANFA